jgi:two-component system, NtrC family, response regulator AlgB
MTVKPQILVIDDDESIRRTLRLCLESADYSVSLASSGEAGVALAKKQPPDLALVDLRLGGMDGLAVSRALTQEAPCAQVVIMTAYATIDNAVEAMRAGASDYLAKPFTPAAVKHVVARVLESGRMRQELAEVERHHRRTPVKSASPAVLEAYTLAERVAGSGATVLILGETGTGKSLLARHVHQRSPRASRPFVTVNCATISTNLIENELFGHAKGAFTGADQPRAGYVEAAKNGSLFVDEVGDLGKETQGKFLRLLEEREYVRVGDTEPRRSDARIIAATHRDLKAAVSDGSFRDDLFYRLNVVTINLPSLRQRREDIASLVSSFLKPASQSAHTRPMTVSAEAMAALVAYDWPGNIRELSNVLERAALLANGDVLTPDLLPEEVRSSSRTVVALQDGDESLEAAERRHIAAVVTRHPTLDTAAKALGVDPSTLYRKRERYGLR